MPLALSEYAIDFAFSSARLNASTLPMSGFSAPARTTMPICERARSTLLPARTNPWRLRSSIEAPTMITTSAGSPRLRRLGIDERRAARRNEAVAAAALECRRELGISLVKPGGDHHVNVRRGCRSRDQQRCHSRETGRPSGERFLLHEIPFVLIAHLVLSRCLEKFHKIAIRILQQDLLAARPYDNIVAET